MNSSIEKGLHLVKSLSWFERCSTVPQWIKVAVEKCKIFIGNAVADDSPIPITDCVEFSRSAQHAEAFLFKVGSFWKNLDWPEPLMSSCYAVMVVNGIAECSVYYVSESARRLDCIEELFDEKGNFSVNQKVSYVHVATWNLALSIPFSSFPLFPPPLSLSLSHTHTHAHNIAKYIPQQCESHL